MRIIEVLRRHQAAWLWPLVIAAAAALAPLPGSQVFERVIIVLLINLIVVLALQMFNGNSGVVSFGQVAFMGIGAYASILFTLPERLKGVAIPDLYPALSGLSLPFLPAVIAAGVIAALAGAVIGLPLMRLSGGAAVIATFAWLIIVHTVLLNWNQVTNGPRTVFGVERLTTLWMAAGWAAAACLAAYGFKASRWGLMLRASREDERAALSIGVDVVRVRWLAFVLSAFFCGAAGALYAHFITSFSAGAFYLEITFLTVAMLIIGGGGSVSGAVLGTLAVTAIGEGMRALESAVNLSGVFERPLAGSTGVVLALAMILILILRPGGLTAGREVRLGLPAKRPSQPVEANQNAG